MRRRAFGLRPVPASRHGHAASIPHAFAPAALRATACRISASPQWAGLVGATPRLAAAGCAKACRVRRWRFVVCSSRRTVHRHAARPRYGASTPRLSMRRELRQGALRPCRRSIDLACVRAQVGVAVARGCRVGHVSIRERSARTSLPCRESWRWRGCALGFMAATLQRKQFPLRCAHSSRAKL